MLIVKQRGSRTAPGCRSLRANRSISLRRQSDRCSSSTVVWRSYRGAARDPRGSQLSSRSRSRSRSSEERLNPFPRPISASQAPRTHYPYPRGALRAQMKDYSNLPDGMTSSEVAVLFAELLTDTEAEHLPDEEVAEALCELSDRQWHTYVLPRDDVRISVSNWIHDHWRTDSDQYVGNLVCVITRLSTKARRSVPHREQTRRSLRSHRAPRANALGTASKPRRSSAPTVHREQTPSLPPHHPWHREQTPSLPPHHPWHREQTPSLPPHHPWHREQRPSLPPHHPWRREQRPSLPARQPDVVGGLPHARRWVTGLPPRTFPPCRT
jgi:hypothetical protein